MPRGRNKNLIERRNAALARRHYYWTEVERLRFDDALKQLSQNEFFISEDRIMAILRETEPYTPEAAASSRIKSPKVTSAQLALFIGE